MTSIAVNRARERARSGRKDESRDWLRYIRNSRIIQILESEKRGLPMDLATLKLEISKLDDECHPQSTSDNSTDLELISARLETIAYGMSQLLGKKSS
jgi:hypothetical protein